MADVLYQFKSTLFQPTCVGKVDELESDENLSRPRCLPDLPESPTAQSPLQAITGERFASHNQPGGAGVARWGISQRENGRRRPQRRVIRGGYGRFRYACLVLRLHCDNPSSM